MFLIPFFPPHRFVRHLLLFFFLMILPPPRSTLFPYTTLFRSAGAFILQSMVAYWFHLRYGVQPAALEPIGDRKSTRLNSSHVSISYAVFCLKKKKNNALNLALYTKN